MPTANRRRFVPHALKNFLAQDAEDKELLVLDDGATPVVDLMPQDDERIRYSRPGKLTVGAKLNLGCAMARGDILCEWDDDDWYAPWRLTYEAEQLRATGASVVGLSSF